MGCRYRSNFHSRCDCNEVSSAIVSRGHSLQDEVASLFCFQFHATNCHEVSARRTTGRGAVFNPADTKQTRQPLVLNLKHQGEIHEAHLSCPRIAGSLIGSFCRCGAADRHQPSRGHRNRRRHHKRHQCYGKRHGNWCSRQQRNGHGYRDEDAQRRRRQRLRLDVHGRFSQQHGQQQQQDGHDDSQRYSDRPQRVHILRKRYGDKQWERHFDGFRQCHRAPGCYTVRYDDRQIAPIVLSLVKFSQGSVTVRWRCCSPKMCARKIATIGQ